MKTEHQRGDELLISHPNAIRFGNANGTVIGIVMKEAVWRAMQIIQAHRYVFEAEAKGEDDFVTSADKAAQKMYVKLLVADAFPDFGMVGEEENLRINCEHPYHNLVFYCDPLDGTKAYMRKQSHGIGTMLALGCDGLVIAAYVGDPMTGEIYGFRPGSGKVHRIGNTGRAELLKIDASKPLSKQYILLRTNPDEHSAHARKLFELVGGRRAVKDIEITHGSIGISTARLWKGEVGMTILPPGKQTPWDIAPIYGISQKLGFVFLRINPETGDFSEWTWVPTEEIVRTDYEILIVHESRIGELRELGFTVNL